VFAALSVVAFPELARFDGHAEDARIGVVG
jgi:hypothetical protein